MTGMGGITLFCIGITPSQMFEVMRSPPRQNPGVLARQHQAAFLGYSEFYECLHNRLVAGGHHRVIIMRDRRPLSVQRKEQANFSFAAGLCGRLCASVVGH